MRRLAIITTHPIQYNAPLFKLMCERGIVDIKVFYSWGQATLGNVYDPDFDKTFTWNIPLLDGYTYESVENISFIKNANSFFGIRNRDLIRRIELYKPDALLVYGWSNYSHLQVLRYFKNRVKILFRGDSTLLDESVGFSFKRIMRRLILKLVYHHIDFALYTGVANKHYFQKHGLREDQLIFTPHTVDNDRFADPDGVYEKEASNWRHRLDIPKNGFVFLFAGKFEAKKDPLLLLEAFRRLNNALYYLIFVGNGKLEADLKNQAIDLPNVRFLDFQNQMIMPTVYRLSDVFILPSKGPGETWGLSVNEAMASSRPVIVSNACGGHFDLVVDQLTGYVFQKGDIDSLVESMRKIYKESNSIRMGEEASRKIKEFNMRKVAEIVEKTVNNLFAGQLNLNQLN